MLKALLLQSVVPDQRHCCQLMQNVRPYLPHAAQLECEFCQDPNVVYMHIKVWDVLL